MTDSEKREIEEAAPTPPSDSEKRGVEQTAPTNTVSSVSAPPPSETKKKDLWDKAAVVASILSSVVLASLALFLNSTIQKTQIQLQKTQLDEAEHSAKLLERSQNAKATTDLIQYLLSGEPSKQRIALIALRRAVQDDDDLVISIVSVVASTSTDQAVFREATETLQASRDPRVANILAGIAVQESRGHDTVRTAVAYQASQRVGVQAAAENGTSIIYGSPPGGAVLESPEVGGGVFTQSLISTLSSTQGPVAGGALDIYALSGYLNEKITSTNLNEPLPFVVSSGATKIPIWAPAAKLVKVLAIGVSKYAEKQLPSLQFPTRDASSFGHLLESHGASVSLLTDDAATQGGILQSIDRFASGNDGSDTFILYFSGHGWNSRGIQQLAAADMKFRPEETAQAPAVPNGIQSRGLEVLIRPREIQGSLALSDVMQHINRLPFRFKLVVIDACSTALDL
jgi:hypothetical protein